MIFETHAHYEDEQFNEDRDELLGSFKENGIDYVVNVSTSLDTAVECMKLADMYDFIYAFLFVKLMVRKERFFYSVFI